LYAGKDRTGLVAMLLLKLAKVPDDLVIADYAVSEHYMLEVSKCRRNTSPKPAFPYQPTSWNRNRRRCAIRSTHIARRYGYSRGYLRHIGLDEQEIGVLAERLIG
jgi:protein-tyrosine phosphatase